MATLSLQDRISDFSERSQLNLLPKLPVITIINGRGFGKITSLLDKPYSDELAQCFYAALAGLVGEIEGAVFGYAHNDELIVVSRNDQELETMPWLDNDAQKIASIASSIATFQFSESARALDLNLLGDSVFYAKTFVVPNITEAINVLVSAQQRAAQFAIYFACFYGLLNKFNRNDIDNMLSETTTDEKINLLKQECGINFGEYPSAFRRGVACYRAPKTVSFQGTEQIRQKWQVNTELPIFTKSRDFLGSIF